MFFFICLIVLKNFYIGYILWLCIVEPAQAHAGAADQEQTIEESPSTILMQVILPFFIAGFGKIFSS